MKVAATLTIRDVPNMTKNGRAAIRTWLCRLGLHIWLHPESFAKTFRARYMYGPKKRKAKRK